MTRFVKDLATYIRADYPNVVCPHAGAWESEKNLSKLCGSPPGGWLNLRQGREPLDLDDLLTA